MASLLYSKRLTKIYSRMRKARPKTFASEEKAKAYAEKNDIKGYSLRNLKSLESKTKKIQLILAK